jgi:hypothetical protein
VAVTDLKTICTDGCPELCGDCAYLRDVNSWRSPNGHGPAGELHAVMDAPNLSALDRARQRLIHGNAILNLPTPPSLIDGVLQLNSLGALYGPSGCGKTFVGIDLALHVATGTTWHQRQVTEGNVLYVIAEGAWSLGPRYQAWLSANQGWQADRIHWLPYAPNLLHKDEVYIVADIAQELDVSLIVIDTLARCMVGADENSARDIGVVVAGLDGLRTATQACILAIHHTGKDPTAGARGSSALKGALDTEIEARGDTNSLTLTMGKVITLDDRHRATVEDKPEIVRAGGVYYTPAYVVDFIVQNTLGRSLETHQPEEFVLSGRRRKRFHILDPACGSGSFLIGAYQYLLDWYLANYSLNPDRWSRGRDARIRQSGTSDWLLTTNERKRILLDHVFGVDIDSQAVEVTKLSLLLKVVEGESEQTIEQQYRLFQERALPDLDENIKCGNSLVGSDAFNHLELSLIDDATRARINAFNWRDEFRDQLSLGGFDVIIGNPPYVYRNATEDLLRVYYDRTYDCVQGNYDLYKFFLERGLELTKSEGRLGYIVSASFLVQSTFSKLREILLASGIVEELAPMGPGVFIRASVDSCIITIRKGGRQRRSEQVAIRTPVPPTMLPAAAPYFVQQHRFRENPGKVFDYRLTDQAAEIVNRLFAQFPTIEDGFEFGVGINTGFVRGEMTADQSRGPNWHPMVAGTGISRYGPVESTGWILYDPDFIRARGRRARSLPQERFFTEDKILVVRTRNLALARRIVATIDTTQSYNLNRLSNLIARPGHDLRGLLGILNSRLFDWLFSTRFYDYEIKPVYLRQCPLADDTDGVLATAVADILLARASAEDSRVEADRVRRVRDMRALDERIDDAVYRLYGVSDSERELIDTQMEAAFEFGRHEDVESEDVA